jgi:hypothetical protein
VQHDRRRTPRTGRRLSEFVRGKTQRTGGHVLDQVIRVAGTRDGQDVAPAVRPQVAAAGLDRGWLAELILKEVRLP